MPILGVPGFLIPVLALFGDLLSRPQQRQLARYLTGLLVGPPWTVRGIARRTVGATDQSNLNRFLTHSPWSEDQINARRTAPPGLAQPRSSMAQERRSPRHLGPRSTPGTPPSYAGPSAARTLRQTGDGTDGLCTQPSANRAHRL